MCSSFYVEKGIKKNPKALIRISGLLNVGLSEEGFSK